jgi:hypothetical protein
MGRMSGIGEPFPCSGEWREEGSAHDGEHDSIQIMKCSVCGERMVIIGSRHCGVFPSSTPTPTMLREAMQIYADKRMLNLW